MTPQPVKTPTTRRLLLVGVAALAAAGAVAANGSRSGGVDAVHEDRAGHGHPRH